MADEGAGGDRYPYKTPRWILWVVALVSVAAVVAAFVVGPKDNKTASSDKTTPTSGITGDTGGGTTTAPGSSTDSSDPTDSGSGVKGTTTTTAPKATTTAPKATTTTAAPKGTTTTTTAPGGTTVTTTTTVPPIVAQTPPPTATATVSQCRIEGASTAVAEGTITNQGSKAWSFTVEADATDGSGNIVARISTTVTAVAPGATVDWTASTDIGANANVVVGCHHAGIATALAA